MTPDNPTIQMIPISAITVLNPRARNKHVFNELVVSIAHLGLKKPITVSPRDDGEGFNLVCGQGRLEAFTLLEQTEIPAIVIEASEEECFVMSLAENLARRQHTSLELMREIYALKERGYSSSEIAVKTDFSTAHIDAICYLFEHGEERLITAIDRGVMPPSIAMQIAHAQDGSVQQALAEAYEKKAIPGSQILAIRHIIEQRTSFGKGTIQNAGSLKRKPVTADSLIRAYRKETERQKLLVKKATLAQNRLLFIVNALRLLLGDDHFTTLLRAETIVTVPRPLAERLALAGS